MKRKWIDFGMSAGIGVAIVVALMALLQAGTEYQEMGVTRFDSMHLDDSGGTATPVFMANQSGLGVIAEFRDSSTPVVQVLDGGELALAAGMALSDGDGTIADDFIIVAQTAISCTDGAVITPTGTYQPLESAGTVTPTMAITDASDARYTTGTLLTLINTANTTINLADSGNVKTSGATALGQYDSLVLWFDGTYWIELAQANN